MNKNRDITNQITLSYQFRDYLCEISNIKILVLWGVSACLAHQSPASFKACVAGFQQEIYKRVAEENKSPSVQIVIRITSYSLHTCCIEKLQQATSCTEYPCASLFLHYNLRTKLFMIRSDQDKIQDTFQDSAQNIISYIEYLRIQTA